MSPAGPAHPALAREPGYQLFLATLMALDPSFGAFTPACLAANTACTPALYRVPRLANLACILATGVIMFLLARRLTGTPIGGLVAAAYLLLNAHANKAWADLLSDRFAALLLAAALLALTRAWRSLRSRDFALAGAACACLTLTKAIFLPSCLAAWTLAAVLMLRRRSRPGPAGLVATDAVFLLLVGGWTVRNWQVSGQLRVTDARSGIALSTRADFDTMTPREYAASLVVWTGSLGPKVAAHWFGHGLADRFSPCTPGGYYDIGQNGYGSRVADLMRAQHLGYWQAVAVVDAQITGSIRDHALGYLATMLPLTYRGLWVDEIPLIGVPCLILALMRALRRRDHLLALLLGIGVYNMLAYAAVSLNIERY
jgi:hypothetical protein